MPKARKSSKLWSGGGIRTLGQIDARRIAEFSGGNARLALALAAAVDDTESLSDFSDAELFDRLFHQRGGLNQQPS